MSMFVCLGLVHDRIMAKNKNSGNEEMFLSPFNKLKLDLLLIIRKIKIPACFLTCCEVMFKMGLLCCNYETRTKD